MANYYTSIPKNLTTLQPDDELVFRGDFNYQHPGVQKLIEQNAVTPMWNGNGTNLTGVKMRADYIGDNTKAIPTNPNELASSPYSMSNSNFWGVNPEGARNLATWQGGGNLQTTANTQGANYIGTNNSGTNSNYNTGTNNGSNNYGWEEIKNLLGGGTAFDDMAAQFQSQYQDLLKTKEERLAEELSTQNDIHNQYSGLRQQVKDTGARNTGALKRMLGRGGSFTTSTGQGALASQLTSIDNQLLALSDAEEAAKQKAVAALRDNDRKALNDSMSLIADIQGKIETANQNKVQNYLALMKLQQDDKQAQKAMNQPVGVAKGTVLVDPTTGKEIYSNKEATDMSLIDPTTIKMDNNGMFYGLNTQTQQMEYLGGEGEQTPEIQNYEYYANQERAVGNTPMLKKEWDLYQANLKQAAAGTITPEDKINLEMKLSKSYLGYTKAIRNSQVQIANINSAYQQALAEMQAGKSINAASQGVLVTFQKMLDPTSVVRESEYARSGEGQSLLNRIDGFYQKLLSGGAGITAPNLKEFVDMSNEFMKNYNNEVNSYAQLTMQQAQNYGLNIENILPAEDIKSYNKTYNSGGGYSGDSGGSTGSWEDYLLD